VAVIAQSKDANLFFYAFATDENADDWHRFDQHTSSRLLTVLIGVSCVELKPYVEVFPTSIPL
jgi:hypothetical protein